MPKFIFLLGLLASSPVAFSSGPNRARPATPTNQFRCPLKKIGLKFVGFAQSARDYARKNPPFGIPMEGNSLKLVEEAAKLIEKRNRIIDIPDFIKIMDMAELNLPSPIERLDRLKISAVVELWATESGMIRARDVELLKKTVKASLSTNAVTRGPEKLGREDYEHLLKVLIALQSNNELWTATETGQLDYIVGEPHPARQKFYENATRLGFSDLTPWERGLLFTSLRGALMEAKRLGLQGSALRKKLVNGVSTHTLRQFSPGNEIYPKEPSTDEKAGYAMMKVSGVEIKAVGDEVLEALKVFAMKQENSVAYENDLSVDLYGVREEKNAGPEGPTTKRHVLGEVKPRAFLLPEELDHSIFQLQVSGDYIRHEFGPNAKIELNLYVSPESEKTNKTDYEIRNHVLIGPNGIPVFKHGSMIAVHYLPK